MGAGWGPRRAFWLVTGGVSGPRTRWPRAGDEGASRGGSRKGPGGGRAAPAALRPAAGPDRKILGGGGGEGVGPRARGPGLRFRPPAAPARAARYARRAAAAAGSNS